MQQDALVGPARRTRRHFLRSAGLLGTVGALWAVGCGPRLVPVSGMVTAQLPAVQLATTLPPTATAVAVEATATPLATLVAPSDIPTAIPTIIPPTAVSTPTSGPDLAAPSSIHSAAPLAPTSVPTPATYDEKRLVDVVGQARRSYAGSSYGLATNIEVAAQRIDGAILAPGAVFSFLDRIGPQTLEAGFKMGYGITVVNGQARTVPMLAGGICDVSTLLFQAVYKTGLMIVDRYSHSYWIASYGAPPDGSLGLEATVDFQPVDFRFANSTQDWLKLSCVCSGGWITITLHGVDPGWQVTIAPPVVANVVKTDTGVVRQADPSLPAGTEVLVEQAQDGFDVTRERQVTSGGRVIDRYRYTAHYLPSHNVILVGGAAKTATPTAVKTVTASPTATGTPSTPVPAISPTPTATLAGGLVRVPGLVGMSASQAQVLVSQAGLSNTYINYQGPDNVPAAALAAVAVGAVLSQSPAPGALVPKGTAVFLAARKK